VLPPVQLPFWHVSPAGQIAPQYPQLVVPDSVGDTHAPSQQRPSPDAPMQNALSTAHAMLQAPSMQRESALQALPQPPQFALSVPVARQACPQHVPATPSTPHTVPSGRSAHASVAQPVPTQVVPLAQG
jgi:hypothetical protein